MGTFGFANSPQILSLAQVWGSPDLLPPEWVEPVSNLVSPSLLNRQNHQTQLRGSGWGELVSLVGENCLVVGQSAGRAWLLLAEDAAWAFVT